jgi:hypothetical protein
MSTVKQIGKLLYKHRKQIEELFICVGIMHVKPKNRKTILCVIYVGSWLKASPYKKLVRPHPNTQA